MPNSNSDAQPNVFGYDNSFGFPVKFWEMAILTGIGAGLAGGVLMALLRSAQHLAWSYKTGDFLAAVFNCSAWHRVLVLLLAGLMVGLSRVAFRRFTGGHGGEVAAAIWFRSGKIPFWRTISTAVVSILSVAFGAAVGRESAPKQAGAAVGSLLAQRAGLPSAQCRLLVACGAGAGMAAVYNVPVGGALFALEVLLGQLSLPLVLPALMISVVAVAVSYLFLPNLPTYDVPAYSFSPSLLAGGLVLGLLAGLCSILFVKAIGWADTGKPKGNRIILTPVLVFAGLGLASIIYPQLLGNGKGLVQLSFLDQMNLPLLAVLLIPRTLATVCCLRAGTPGGLFTPTMTAGALLGGLFGHLWSRVLPGPVPATYAIFGAAALLAASTKGPVSALVLIFELINHVTVLAVPLMLTVAVATLVGQ